MGITHEPIKIDPLDTSKPKLLDHYVFVPPPPVDLRHEDLFVPRSEENEMMVF